MIRLSRGTVGIVNLSVGRLIRSNRVFPGESVTSIGLFEMEGKDGLESKERALSVRDKKVIEVLSRLSA